MAVTADSSQQGGRPPSGAAADRLLAMPEGLPPERRSVILETSTRLVFHTVLVFAVHLLFSGHNAPGGGFVGGLVAGLAFVLRYVAGGRRDLLVAVPFDPGLPLGVGLLLAAGTGMGSWVVGGEFLESAILETDLPVLGHVKLVTSLFFDLGVFLVVVGLVLAVLRTLGAEAEARQ